METKPTEPLIFTMPCMEFFDSASVEKEETTAGVIFNLRPGWNSFQKISQLRNFLQLDFVLSSTCVQKVTVTVRDFENANFCVRTQVIPGTIPARIRMPCPKDWLQCVEIYCATACTLIGVEGVDFKRNVDTFSLNSQADLEVSSNSATCKFKVTGVELEGKDSGEPWEAHIKTRNAFSRDTVYVEHFSTPASTQIFDGQAEALYVKGEVSLCKSGVSAGLGSTTVRSESGATVKYKTEALMVGNPQARIRRISERGGNNVSYYV